MGTGWKSVVSTRFDARTAPKLSFAQLDLQAPSAWFLGPNAENEATLADLIGHAIAEHARARRDYAPGDPDLVSKAAASDDVHRATRAHMKHNLSEITTALRGSIPLSSHRNQSHMYWDITLPGAVGYFAGMLFNQNNVAAEASPVTTALELRVARDLCHMLGYDVDGAPKPWGHITCDGSVANAESMWAARNLKYQAVSLARAIREEGTLAAATDITVRRSDGRRCRVLDLDPWALLNLSVDEALALPQRVVTDCGIDESVVQTALGKWSIQSLGLPGLHDKAMTTISPAIMVPATAHYSWGKAATLLGLGSASLRHIPVDLEGRMSLPDLRRALNQCLNEGRPVLQVVAVMGSTEESAVDPLADIAAMRDEFAEQGLNFVIHADAAWGGYFASMLRPTKARIAFPEAEMTAYDHNPKEPLSPYVLRHFQALRQADTITVDPHKAGYAPYPAGSLCYRNGAMPMLIAVSAPVVFHDGAAPSVGVYGIEGSKPGAAAAGVALAHATIPPDDSGFGRLLGRCIFNAKRFYAAVVSMAGPEDPFTVTPFQRLPAEKAGATPNEVEAQRQEIGERITGYSNEMLVKALGDDPLLMDLFRALGPDLNVFAYAFNFRVQGRLNTDLALMNELNRDLFDAMSIQTSDMKGDVPKQDMFVTASSFDPAIYGNSFTDHFAARAGVMPRADIPIRFLISTMQNPWLTETETGNFIPELIDVLRREVLTARQKVIGRYGLE